MKNPTVAVRKSPHVKGKDEPMFVKRHRNGKAERKDVTIECNAREGRTRQEHKNEVDINVIMRRYRTTGELPRMTATSAGERDDSVTLQDAIHTMRDVQKAWQLIPARIAQRYPHWLGLAMAIGKGEVVLDKEKNTLTFKRDQRTLTRESPIQDSNKETAHEKPERNRSVHDDQVPEGSSRKGGRREDRVAD